mmetsp:Transcript_44578/g.102220  ORF Transcript_44578/g.102220 Transcript_44578/m.102220 type:complete len:167 (-) Transcript_44578:122-622(-)
MAFPVILPVRTMRYEPPPPHPSSLMESCEREIKVRSLPIVTQQFVCAGRSAELVLQQLLNFFLDIVKTRSNDLPNLLAVLNELERRHRGNRILAGDFFVLVHINFAKVSGGCLFGQLREGGGDALAWTTPGGSKVHHHQLVAGFLQCGVERLFCGVLRKSSAQAKD